MAMEKPNIQKITNFGGSQAKTTDFLAALYADLDSDSAWTVSNSTVVTASSPGAGSFAFTAKPNSKDYEITFRNSGTTALINEQYIKIIIDPLAGITNSADLTGATYTTSSECTVNLGFSGVGDDATCLIFDDELFVLFEDSGNNYYPYAFAAGTCFLPFSADLASASYADGTAILTGIPGVAYSTNVDGFWLSFYSGDATDCKRTIRMGFNTWFDCDDNYGTDFDLHKCALFSHTNDHQGSVTSDTYGGRDSFYSSSADGTTNTRINVPHAICCFVGSYANESLGSNDNPFPYGVMNHAAGIRTNAQYNFSAKDRLGTSDGDQWLFVQYDSAADGTDGWWIPWVSGTTP